MRWNRAVQHDGTMSSALLTLQGTVFSSVLTSVVLLLILLFILVASELRYIGSKTDPAS